MNIVLFSARLLRIAWLGCAAIASHAQEYPTKPIKLVIPFAPGGATDVVGRLVAQGLGKQLGQTVVVENVSGAAGAIGTAAAAKAAPDGYTICFCTTGPQVILPFLTKLQFDPVRDLVPVVQVHNVPNILLARTSLTANTVPELIALAKREPGKLTFGTPGNGGPQHLAGELFQALTGTKMVHVPYKGESPAFMDLVGGQIDTALGSVSVAEPLIKAGKIKVLGVTGLQRSPSMPNVPAVAETVPGFTGYSFVGLNMPAGTSKAIIDKLNRAANQVLQDPVVRETMAAQNVEPVGGTPEAYAAFLRDERTKWSEVIKRSKVTLE